MATNRFGLDVSYFKEKLGLLVRDCDNYTPAEMARSLERLRDVALPDAPNGRCECGNPCAGYGAKVCKTCWMLAHASKQEKPARADGESDE